MNKPAKPFVTDPFRGFSFWFLITWKTGFFLLFQYYIEDYWHHQTLAIHLSEGKGLHYLNASSVDLSVVEKFTEFKWPPLLTILLAGLLRLVGNMTVATGILVASSMTCIFLAVRLILNALSFSNKRKWALWFLFLFNPILTDLFSVSDIIALSVWIFGFAFFIRYLQTGNRPSLIFWSFILFLPAAFRYQYYPLIFIIPALCFITSGFADKREMRRLGLGLSVGVFLFLLTQILLLKLSGNAGAYIADIVEWSPQNLKRIYAYFINAFAPFYLFINKTISINQLDVRSVYHLFGIGSFILFTVFSLQIFRRRKNNSEITKAFVFPVFFLLIYLSTLSLIYKEQNNGGAPFTYVQEPRYWGLMYLLLPILAATLHRKFPVRRIYFFIGAIILLIPNMVRIGKLLFTEDDSALYTHKMKFKQTVSEYIESDQLKEKRPVVIACYDRDFAMYNAKIPYAYLPLDSLYSQKQIQHSAPIWLYVITRDTLSDKERAWMDNHGLQETLRWEKKHRLFERRR